MIDTSGCQLSPGRRCARVSLAWISVGVPSARVMPRSSTTILSHWSMTKPMSCSTSRMAHCRLLRSRPMASLRWPVSSSPSPDVGSSSSSTLGVSARARPNSTMRACPMGSDPAGVFLSWARPQSSNTSSTWRRRSRSLLRRLGRLSRSATTPPPPPRHSWAHSRLSSTVSRPKICWRWNVRRRPLRERQTDDRLVMSTPSSSIVPRSGSRSPEMTSNKVVLPAPFGPMRPWTSPGATDIETSDRARTPPKLT